MSKPSSARQSQLQYILHDEGKRAGETEGIEGILASLFRRVLARRQIDVPRWTGLMQRFLTNPRLNPAREGKERKDHTSVRANLTKELIAPHMTWKVFCKGLIFQGIYSVRVSVTFELKPGVPVTEFVDVDFGVDTKNLVFGELEDQVAEHEVDRDERTEQHENTVPPGTGNDG